MKALVNKTSCLALIFLVTALNVRAQGTVNFVNTAGTLVQTNASGVGGTTGNTAPIGQARFYYALFTAPSSVTTIDPSLQGLVSGPWTFTLYATNTTSAGRLNGGNDVSVPGWASGSTLSFIVVGWSANLGADWNTVRGELTGASLAGGVWSGGGMPNSLTSPGFLGASAVAQGAAGNSPPTALPLFGGSGIGSGFNLYVVPSAAPGINAQPTDQRVPAGQNATFTVTVSGTAPFTYEWQFNGIPVAGASNSSYTVVGAQIQNVGLYNVVITNSFGSVTSAPGTLSLAYTAVWTNSTSGKWETPNNWVAAFLPASTQSVFVVNSGAKTLTLDATTAGTFSNTMVITNLTLADTSGASNVVDLAIGGVYAPLHILNSLSLQTGGSMLIDSNSLLEVDGQTSIGDHGSAGVSGIGALVLNSGSATFANAVLGNTTNANGLLTLNGGSLLVTNTLTVGAHSSATGVVSMTSGRLIVTNGTLTVASNGIGTFTHSGGTNQAALVAIGAGAGSQGFYTLSNATLNAGTLNLGNGAGGLGTLTVQSNAIVNIASNVTLVSGSLATTSSISLSGGSFNATNGLVQVGPMGNGQILVTGGSHTMRQLWLGSSNGLGAGSLYVLGGSLRILGRGIGPGDGLVANAVAIGGLSGDFNGVGTSITIGYTHDALAFLYGSGTAECAALYVGYSPGFTGTYLQMDNGVMTVSNMMIVGDCASNATGVVTLSGGTLYVTNADHTAFLDVRNGTFTLGSNSTLVVDNLVMTNACGLFMNTGGRLLSTYPPTLWPHIVPSASGGSASLSFQTVTSTTYIIQQTTDLGRPAWSTYATITGDGSFTNITFPNVGHTRFFRVRQ